MPALCVFAVTILLQAGAPLAEFQEKLGEYASLRDSLESRLGEPPHLSHPASVAAWSRALADAIRSARADARQGSLFTPEVESAFKQMIRNEMSGPRGMPLRNAIRDGNPKLEQSGPGIDLAPNAHYPDDAPLSTIPPGLLRRLPALPPYLEYRFVGQDLILLDNGAGLIVDFIRHAAP
jgi:hypothetical protein